jgi:hypothetical protein
VTAWAKPRVQVAPFSVKGESLAFFGPEVGRAMAAALEGAGVETGAGAPDAIVGRVEELPNERVRLTATLRGKTLSAEGPLEAIDAVATSLANKLAPLLLENDPAAQKLAEKRARDAERRAASVPPSRPAPRPRKVEAAPPAETKPETKPPPVEEAKPAAPPATEAPAAETPATSAPEAKPEAKAETRPEPPKPEWVPPRVDTPPPQAQPRADVEPPAPPSTPPPYFGGFVRGRVVAHAIAEPMGAYPTAGVMATQALYAFLQRRLRLSVIPTGVGITSPRIAADEAYRAAARAVVMARLDEVEILPGPTARVRLEIEVIRDGRPVMRRVVESAPSDVGRRPLASDPIYQSVTMALEALVPELVGALADVR